VSGIPGFEKIVVVKRILPQLATNQEFIQMFLDEARIAATLHHPNIVQMYDIGAVDGNYFISMEYLHGEDLRTLVRQIRTKGEKLPLEHALNVIIGLSAGLHYAHEKVGFDGKPLGIVHRDVTPQNVFITYDGGVKIVDFGIAKATNRFNETRYGTLKGKIPYMSPEQCRSEPLDRRSDVFAIGIMLYELTTGYRLYKGRSEFEILKRIVEGDVTPPSVLRPGYPRSLERILMRALAKRREDRYQTAQELQADLEGFAREHRLPVSPIALAASMQKLFGNKLEAWREAQAAGTVAEHLVERHAVEKRDEIEELSSEELEELPADTGAGASSSPGDVREATPSAMGEVTPLGKPPSRTRLVWLVAVGVLGAAAAAIAFLILRNNHAPAPEDPPAATTAAAAAPGSESESKPPPTPAPSPATTLPEPADPVVEPVPAPPVLEAAGMVKVTSRPSGAGVFVDSKPWREPTPTVIDGLPPGEHQIKVELAGHDVRRINVQVKPNETAPVHAELRRARGKPDLGPGPERPDKPDPAVEAAPGELRIASTPSCEVIIDGKARGSTPLTGIKLPAGAHAVQLVNSRFGIDRTFTVEVRSGEVTKKKYDFPVAPN
jgi:hypothetical protein